MDSSTSLMLDDLKVSHVAPITDVLGIIDNKTFPKHETVFSEGTKTLGKHNLTQKISSTLTANDPFKNLYRTEWKAFTTKDEANSLPSEVNPSPKVTSSTDNKTADNETSTKEPLNLDPKFQNITLQRVLALRKVQSAIQTAPNTSVVGAHSTSFSEDDLKCLTMEELSALQRRKRDLHKEVQPLSVVKVSIQAERSRKRLEPRDYQIELYERARRENTIAVLGTGTGKTLIACLLIKDILIAERVSRKNGEKVTPSDRLWGLICRKNCVFSSFLLFIWSFSREMSSKRTRQHE